MVEKKSCKFNGILKRYTEKALLVEIVTPQKACGYEMWIPKSKLIGNIDNDTRINQPVNGTVETWVIYNKLPKNDAPKEVNVPEIEYPEIDYFDESNYSTIVTENVKVDTGEKFIKEDINNVEKIKVPAESIRLSSQLASVIKKLYGKQDTIINNQKLLLKGLKLLINSVRDITTAIKENKEPTIELPDLEFE